MPSLLCLNVGSSSLAFALFPAGASTPAWTGGIDLSVAQTVALGRPGEAPGVLDVDDPADFPAIAALLIKREGEGAIPVHRIVHGGQTAQAAAWLDAAEIARLDTLAPLAPVHQPAGLSVVRRLAEERPGLRQIAVFDTAFHYDMPLVARQIPVAPEVPFVDIRRYGFHGLSHGWVARKMAAEAPDCRRIVSLHLSGGSSACAILDGQSVDTSMGATPLDGLMMGTRSGAVDPGLLLYALKQEMSCDDLENLLWHRSGLLGVSGISSDLRDILPDGSQQAEAAVALFCRRTAKAVSEMAVSAGGLDALVFTGGAGAEQPVIRQRIVAELAWLGLSLDDDANTQDAAIVSAPDSAVQIRAMPTEEERMMAHHAATLIQEDDHAH
ncbi:acetate kinase [Loktanella sp. SALINAS62]|uniref:acetate/propionate family kinase n=1 Tax=Loktanella sp. SALINAS62 TaxID=2706124 RepID=UPI001B8C7011|nr:acetate kinase [Loktanella sp. SALINAS62]MBS1302243.1 acetate kinase [Loktanella sp. SALINAS62]